LAYYPTILWEKELRMKAETKKKVRGLSLYEVDNIVEWMDKENPCGDCPLGRTNVEEKVGSLSGTLSCSECLDVFEDLPIKERDSRWAHPCNRYGLDEVMKRIYDLIPLWLEG